MPIIGTPVTSPLSPGTADYQGLVSPGLTARYGTPMPQKRRAVLVQQGQSATLEFPIFTRDGNPVDLTTYGIGLPGPTSPAAASVQFLCREAISQSNPLMRVTATPVYASVGQVQVAVPLAVANNPGVYSAEMGVVASDGTLIFRNAFYLWVDRGLFGTPATNSAGPPQLDEVRMVIADYDPGYNLLLNDFEQDLANVCIATELSCRYWNEAQPPIGVFFDTTTYPATYRQYWLTGIAGYLYKATAAGFLRSHLPYAAAGVSVDDQNKWQQYLQIGQQLSEEYREWVKQKKVSMNCEAAITSLGSSYSAYGYWP